MVWSPHIIKWGDVRGPARAAAHHPRATDYSHRKTVWHGCEIRRQAFTRSAAFNQVKYQTSRPTWCPPAPDPRSIGSDTITVTRHGYSGIGIKGTARDIGYSE